MRSIGGRASKRYVARLYATVEKMKPGVFAKRSAGRFTGARLGRGAGAGAAAAIGARPFAKFRARRVAVKIRSVRLGAAGLAKARAHLNYIQRDSAARGKGRGELYGAEGSAVDGARFLEEGSGDRHQFRIILSPEDGSELQDLTQFTRDLMAAASRDLETRLDWVAVNHFHTDHPHVHVVLRGRSEDGGDLIIARNYITHGFRRRAEELATLKLGPRRDLDIARSRAADVSREAFTTLDRDLLERAAAGPIRFDAPETPYDRFQSKLLKDRLQTLQAMALAERRPDGWRLAPDLERRLREAGRRGDIIRSMGAELGADLAPHRLRDFTEEKGARRLVGRVAGVGAADDAHERRFLAIEGADGAQWHAPIDLTPGAAPPIGAIVEITRAGAAPRAADRTIAAIAGRHGGVYTDALHSAADPASTAGFRLAHKRRLEALRRAGLVERSAEGAWRIPEDFLERAAAHEGERSMARVRVLSWTALDQLPGAGAITFLDDVLEKRVAIERVPHGFGAELDRALGARRRWLLAQGLADEDVGALRIDRRALALLQRDALAREGARLERGLGKSFIAPVEGERFSGVYRRPVDIASGRYALIERSKEFTLLPWRDALELRRGLEISAVLRRGGISWDVGRERGLGR